MELSNAIGLILPPIIDFVNSRATNHKARYLIALGVSIAVAIATNFSDLRVVIISLQFNDVGLALYSLQNLFQSFAVIALAAKASYELYWKDSGPRQTLFNK